MAAANYDMLITQGATLNRTFNCLALNSPIPFPAGSIAQFSAKPSPNIAGKLLLNYISSPQESHITLSGSTLTLTLLDTETEYYTWQYAVYDIFIVVPNGTRIRVLAGKLVVVPTVTHL